MRSRRSPTRSTPSRRLLRASTHWPTAFRHLQTRSRTSSGRIGFLQAPLNTVKAVVAPVEWALDAVDFIFNTVVSPVLNPILDALGVNRSHAARHRCGDVAAARRQRLRPSRNFVRQNPGRAERSTLAAARERHRQPRRRHDRHGGPRTAQPAPTDDAEFVVGDDHKTSDGGTTINALGGDDIVSGGIGNDTISGGDGNDIIIGGAGNDIDRRRRRHRRCGLPRQFRRIQLHLRAACRRQHDRRQHPGRHACEPVGLRIPRKAPTRCTMSNTSRSWTRPSPSPTSIISSEARPIIPRGHARRNAGERHPVRQCRRRHDPRRRRQRLYRGRRRDRLSLRRCRQRPDRRRPRQRCHRRRPGQRHA